MVACKLFSFFTAVRAGDNTPAATRPSSTTSAAKEMGAVRAVVKPTSRIIIPSAP